MCRKEHSINPYGAIFVEEQIYIHKNSLRISLVLHYEMLDYVVETKIVVI